MREHTPVTLVLCEGKDDRLVMERLAQHCGLDAHLKFESYDGESNLRAFLANLKVSPEFARGEYAKILVTRDADSDYDAAWKSIQGSMQKVFAQTVTQPGEWIELESGGKMAAWVIPGADQTGMIETLCLNAARSNDPVIFACLDPFVACLEANWGQKPHEKVRFGLWTIIAQGQKAKHRLSMERAIANIDFNWDDSAYDSLKQLFRDISE